MFRPLLIERARAGVSLTISCLVHRLAQERFECAFVDVGAFADLDVPHELPFAVEESHRILEYRAAEESELHVVGCGVNIGDRGVPL